jgi:hypothetical protein
LTRDHRGVITTQLNRVLVAGGVEVQRPQSLGVTLLQHEHPPHVWVMRDRHPRRGLVLHLRDIGALHPLLSVFQRVEVTAGQRRDRLGADHHPGVLDDLEHLRDAVVHITQ